MLTQGFAVDGAFLLEVALRSTFVLLGTLGVMVLLGRGKARPRSLMIACAFVVLMGVMAVSVVANEGFWKGVRVELPLATWKTEPALKVTLPEPSASQTVAENRAQEPTVTEHATGPAAIDGITLFLTRAGLNDSPVQKANLGTATKSHTLSVVVFRGLVGVWLVGTAIFLLRILIGLVQMRNITTRAQPAPQGVADAFEALLPAEQQASMPRLLVSSDIAVPMTWGLAAAPFFRPVVLVPERVGSWSKERLEVVLLHELGHVILGDWAARLMARVVRGAYWWQPLAHWACRRLELEQELACDEWVVQRIRPSDYAQHLLSLHRELQGQRTKPLAMALPVLPMLSRQQLERRVMNLLDPLVLRKSTGKPVLLVALCCMVLVAAVQPEVVRRTVLPVELSAEVVPVSEAPFVPVVSNSFVVVPERLVEVAPPRSLQAQAAMVPPFPTRVVSLGSGTAPVVWPPAPPRGIGFLALSRKPSPEEEALARARRQVEEMAERNKAMVQSASQEQAYLLVEVQELQQAAERKRAHIEHELAERRRELAKQFEATQNRYEELEMVEERRLYTELMLAEEQENLAELRTRTRRESALAKAEKELLAVQVRNLRASEQVRSRHVAVSRVVQERARERAEKSAEERAQRLERNQLRKGRQRHERSRERLRSSRSTDRDELVRAKQEHLERLRAELAPLSAELVELRELLASERPHSLSGLMPISPVRLSRGSVSVLPLPAAPVAPRPMSSRLVGQRFDAEIRDGVEAVIREEAVALGLDGTRVDAALEQVVEVLGTHRRRESDGEVVRDQIFVVGSPGVVREMLTKAWQEELQERIGTERHAQLKSAIGRLAYQILEVQIDRQ